MPDPIHPVVVHFPIVFAVLLPLVVAGALVAVRRGVAVRSAWSVAMAMVVALGISAWVSVRTGEAQEDRVEDFVPGEALHEEAAEILFASVGILLVVAAVGFAGGRVGAGARMLTAAGALVVFGLAARVGYSGGELVYVHGAAEAYVQPGPPGAEPQSENSDTTERDHDSPGDPRDEDEGGTR